MSSYLDVLPAMCGDKHEYKHDYISRVVLLAKITLALVLEAGTDLVSVPLLICAGFVYCHCTGRWAVLDNTHCNDSGAFR